MQLSSSDYIRFMHIHQNLIHYAGLKTGLFAADIDFEAYMDVSMEEKYHARNAVYETEGLIDDFVKENPIGLSEEDLDIALGFKDFIDGDFYVVKYLKKYNGFLQDGVAYGVLGLSDPLEHMLYGEKPVLLETVLLPFKGQIIFDGLFLKSPFSFGKGYRDSINREYQLAKSRHGIITQLPFELKDEEESLEDELAFYMKSKANREEYYYEILDMLDDHPELEGKFNWLLGKASVREKRKHLKSLGIKDIHYGIVGDTIIAQAESAYQVKEMAKAILPKDKLDWVFYFKV